MVMVIATSLPPKEQVGWLYLATRERFQIREPDQVSRVRPHCAENCSGNGKQGLFNSCIMRSDWSGFQKLILYQT